MKTKIRANRVKTISEVCGQPEDAFKRHLKEKEEALERMNKRVDQRIRETLTYEEAWAVA